MTRVECYEILIKFRDVDSMNFFSPYINDQNTLCMDDFDFQNYPVNGKEWRRLNIVISGMLSCNYNLRKVEATYGVARSTMNWWIHHKLPNLSEELYAVMKKQFEYNRIDGIKRGIITRLNR